MGSEDTAALDFAKKFNKPRLVYKFFSRIPFLAQYSVSRGQNLSQNLNELHMKNTIFLFIAALSFSAAVSAQSTVDSIHSKYQMQPMP